MSGNKRITWALLAFLSIAGFTLGLIGCGVNSGTRDENTPGYTGGPAPGTPGGGPVPGIPNGGNPCGETVPGNVEIGLAENPEAPRIAGGTSDERAVAEEINDFREQNGLNRLEWNDAVADAERSHAYDCEQLGYFGHGAKSDPNNYDFCTQRGKFLNLPGLYECGYGGGASGALSAWANSSAHRAALLRRGLKVQGVGIGSSGAPTFWASLLQ